MKKLQKCKRILATLLVALMVLQQSSVMTLAEELQTEVQTEAKEETTEQEKKAEVSEPESAEQTEAVTEAQQTETQQTEAVKETEEETTEAETSEVTETEVSETEMQTETEEKADQEAAPLTNSEAEIAVETTKVSDSEYELKDYVTNGGITVSVKKGSDLYNPNESYDQNQTFHAALEFVMDNSKIHDLQNSITVEDKEITFTYQMPEMLKISNEAILEGDLPDGHGRYEITQGGLIKFKLTKEFFLQSSIEGKCDYYFCVNKESINEKNQVAIKFPGTTADTVIKFKVPNMQVNKTHTVDADGNLTFTITVTGKDRTGKNVVLCDKPGSNLNIDKDSVKINDNKTAVTENSDGSFNISIGEVKENDVFKITYTASIKDINLVENGNIKDLKNDVNWKINGEEGGNTTDWVSVSTYKAGQKSQRNDNADQSIIDWTVSLNNGTLKKDISGYVYTDKMTSENQKYNRDVKVIRKSDNSDITNVCKVEYHDDTKTFDVTFPENMEHGKEEYQILYSTQPKTDLAIGEEVQVRNEGKLNNDEVTGATAISKNPGREEGLTKSGQFNYSTNKMTWTVVYTPGQNGSTDFVFEDTLAHGAYQWNGKEYQNCVFSDRVDPVITYDGKTLVKDTDYRIAYSKSSQAVNAGADGNDVMKITMIGTYTKPVTIVYETVLEKVEAGTSGNIYNSCQVGEKTAGAWVGYTYKSSINKQGNYYNNKDGKSYIDWTIYVNSPNASQPDNTEKGEIDCGGRTVTVSDVLPAGLTYVSAEYCKWDNWTDHNNKNYQAIAPTENGNTLTFAIANVHQDVIAIKVTTEVQSIYDEQGNHAAYTNKASWSLDGNGEMGSASKTVNTVYEAVKKSGTESLDKTKLIYTVEVNKDELKLLNNSDTLILTDQLPSNVELVTGSIHIQDKNDNPLSNAYSSYQAQTRTLTFAIPDATYAIVTYQVAPKLTGLNHDDNGTYTIKVSNKIEMEGVDYIKSEVAKDYHVKKATASVTADRHMISLRKVDAADTAKKLEGAQFKLSQIVFSTNGGEEKKVDVKTTDKDGKVVFNDLNFDNIYCYEEIAAPDGYITNNEKFYFCIKDQDSAFETMKSNFAQAYPGEELIAYNGGEEITFSNVKKSVADITVKKELNGADLKDYVSEFEFKLVEVADAAGNVLSTNEFSEEATAEIDGTVKFPSIQYTEVGKHYYKISELQGKNSNIKYDKSEYIVEVDVQMNLALKRLTATVIYPEGGITFKNIYTQPKGKANIQVKKVVKGKNAPEEEFVFVLTPEGNAPEPESKEIHIKAGETKGFGDIVYNEKGTYKYTIKENKGPTPGMNYDETEHEITVTVGDDLQANVNYGAANENTLIVTNTYNNTTLVEISKVDIADGKELEGAHLQILDKDGNVVTEWISTKEAHEVTGLLTGVSYTLRETVAPDGYDLTTDTTFELKADGTIDAEKTTTKSKDGVLLVEDKKTEKVEKTNKTIKVTKRLVSIDGPVLIAKNATFHVALYSDEACTKRVSEVKALEFKNASAATVTFENLKEDTTYYVGECTPDGTCISVGETSDGVRYTADFGSSNKVVIEKADGTSEVHFDNQFLNVPDGYSIEAYLNITKKVKDADGNAKNSNETFYAGLFADKECTKLSDEVAENIIALSMDGASEKTVQIMLPIIPGGTVKLYVAEVDKTGKPVAGTESFAYDVEVSGSEIVLSDKQTTSNVTITNSERREVESETESTTEKTTTEKTTSKTTTAAKTGDNTPIGMLVGLLMVSVAVMGTLGIRRKRNQK